MLSFVKYLVCGECYYLLIFPPPDPLTVSNSLSNGTCHSLALFGEAVRSLNVKGSICPHLASCPGLKFTAQGPSFSQSRLDCFPFIPACTWVHWPVFLYSCGYVRSSFINVAPVFVQTTYGFPWTTLAALLQTSTCCNTPG